MNNHNSPNQEDFYINEQGLMVFTEAYHLKRGYCCKNGCKHCPYKQTKNKMQQNNKQEDNKKT